MDEWNEQKFKEENGEECERERDRERMVLSDFVLPSHRGEKCSGDKRKNCLNLFYNN